MKIIKFSFSTSLLSCIKWKDHTVLLMNNLFLFVPSGHFFDQVFFNWAPSNLSFALRFFNLFGKTLSHVFSFLSSQKKCFRFESVHTHFFCRCGSLWTHTLGLSGLRSVGCPIFTWCLFVDTSATFVRFPFPWSTWQNESRTLSVAEKLSVMSWMSFNQFIYWLFIIGSVQQKQNPPSMLKPLV